PDGMVLLEALETSTTTMTTVIEDFIDTAALQTGNLNLKLEEITLDPIVKSLLVQYTAHAARKNITLQIDQITGCVRADMARFQQALGNLVSNAIKYSPVNTTVKLWMEDFGAIRRICVTDQGPGIPVQEQERLFTQFGKLTPRPTDGESSTGLGLWIVKHLITLQEGHVGVETSPGSGSTFWIEMPAA
ncbi:MAG TPA: HAMP domain-containing sensor histidine kinase, partial [Phototrophicaceae bacterium]|nr:HAMP domain-containing sensor histidine kinase [Phototrophicaceae bacterium]